MKFFVLGALVSKVDLPRITHSHVSGYRVAESADAARGSFLTSVRDGKPGFSMDDMLCMEIPLAELQGAVALLQGEQS